MILFKQQIDFMRFRNVTFVISGALILAGAVSLAVQGGFHVGIHFTGGVDVRVRIAGDVGIDEVRETLADRGLGENIQGIGDPAQNEYLVKVPVQERGNEETVDDIIEIDCEAHTIVHLNDRINIYPAMRTDEIRREWLTVEPGDNDFTLTDPSYGNINVLFRFRDRWL